MKRIALLRAAVATFLLALSAGAYAGVQVNLSGTTHAGSNAVATGLPITGSFSFDPAAALPGYSNSTTANFSAPGSAQFTVAGSTYSYSTLTDVFRNSTDGAVVFDFANATSVLTLVTFTSNSSLSFPTVDLLTGRFFLDACTPASGSTCIAADPTRIYAEVLPSNGAVPEPASWAMLLLGFGGIGLALRRRRTAVLACFSGVPFEAPLAERQRAPRPLF